jgi:hypothetical protein
MVSYRGLASGNRFTDAGGNTQVGDVPCGGYWLTVSKPDFVSGKELAGRLDALLNPGLRDEFNTEFTEQAGRTFSPVNERVNLTTGSPPVRIALLPVSSIVGVVLDENGDPVEGVSVQGIAAKSSLTGTDYVPAQTARTDDCGRYSLLGLAPGDYVVRLAGKASSMRYFQDSTLNLDNDHRAMQPIYYPGMDTVSSAMVLHLTPGERVSADFHHATQPAFDISGRLIGFVPQASTRMELYPNGDKMPVGGVYVNLSSGQFRAVDLPPGGYTLRAVQYQADAQQWFAVEEPVLVQAEPIRDLAMQLSRGVDIPVSVSYEAGAESDGPVQLMLQPQHTRGNMRELMVGNFAKPQSMSNAERSEAARPSVLTNVIPDRYRLSVKVLEPGKGYVSSARLWDVDVLRGEFSIGGSAGELHVTVRGDSASVQGQVTYQGRPAVGAQIYLIPAAAGPSGPKLGICDRDGRYNIPSVPPGDFHICAWMGSPTVKDLLSGAGETLTLQPGENRTVLLDARRSSTDPEQREQ